MRSERQWTLEVEVEEKRGRSSQWTLEVGEKRVGRSRW
jgi:hypothetical protein